MYHYKPCVHTNSLYIQDNQKPLKVVNTASPYCSFEDCATKLNYEYAWLIYQAEVNIVNIDFTMHDIKETGARSTSGQRTQVCMCTLLPFHIWMLLKLVSGSHV